MVRLGKDFERKILKALKSKNKRDQRIIDFFLTDDSDEQKVKVLERRGRIAKVVRAKLEDLEREDMLQKSHNKKDTDAELTQHIE